VRDARLLFDDLHPVRLALLCYCMECVAHRMVKWGVEPHINAMPPRDLVLLAAYLPPHVRVNVEREAIRRAEAENDHRVLAFLGVARKASAA